MNVKKYFTLLVRHLGKLKRKVRVKKFVAKAGQNAETLFSSNLGSALKKVKHEAPHFHTKCPTSVYKNKSEIASKGEVIRLMTQNSDDFKMKDFGQRWKIKTSSS